MEADSEEENPEKELDERDSKITELEKKNQMLEEEVCMLKEKLCKYELLGDASRINTENDEYQAVTVEQFNHVARKIFRPENCSTLYYGPRW